MLTAEDVTLSKSVYIFGVFSLYGTACVFYLTHRIINSALLQSSKGPSTTTSITF